MPFGPWVLTMLTTGLLGVGAADPAGDDPSHRVEASDSVPEAAEWFGGLPWADWRGASGDWGGGRRRLERSGLAVTAGTTVEGVATEEGLLQLQRTEAVVAVDLPVGLRASVQVHAKTGHDGAPFPSSQGLSSLDAPDFAGLGEAWLEWRSGDRAGARVKGGLVDANSEYAISGAASGFANPAFGLSPALGALPSYPEPAWSLNGFVQPGGALPEVGAGLYRAPGGRAVFVAQVVGGAGSVALSWQAGVVRGGGGVASYLVVEGVGGSGPAPFLILARDHGAGALHAAAGVAVPGPALLAGTSAGLAASGLFGAGDREGVIEGYLEVRPTRWLVVQPDVQVVAERGEAGVTWSAAGLLRVSFLY